MYCNQCGAILEEGQAFCMRCGNKVSESVTQPTESNATGPQKMILQPTGKKHVRKGLVAAIVFAIVALIAAVAGAAFLIISTGLFLPVPEKILLAGVKTFKTPTEVGKTIGQVGKILNDDFTISGNLDYENFELSNTSISCGEGRLQAAGDVSYVVVNAKDCIVDLDDEALRLSVPKFYDKTVAYYYREEAKMLEQMSSEYVEQANDALITINTLAHNRKLAIDKKEYKVFLEWWNQLEYDTEKGVKTEIDGKKQKCTVYSVDISGNDVKELIDITDKFVEKNTNEEIQNLMEHYSISTTDFFDDIKEELNGDLDETITIEFYVYKGKIVRLSIINPEDDEIRINMNGKKSPWMDSEVMYKEKIDDDYETVFTAEYELEDGVESYRFEAIDEGVVKFEYNTADGIYDLQVTESEDTSFAMKGTFLADAKTCSFDIDSVESYGDKEAFTLTTSISIGAEFREYPEEEFNMNDADMFDLAEMGGKIKDKFNIFN